MRAGAKSADGMAAVVPLVQRDNIESIASDALDKCATARDLLLDLLEKTAADANESQMDVVDTLVAVRNISLSLNEIINARSRMVSP